MNVEIPEPSPELYERAAEIAQETGWITGQLSDIETDEEGLVEPILDDLSFYGPCCINGHLMLACGASPTYSLYPTPEYSKIAAEVRITLGLPVPIIGSYREFEAEEIERWNDRNNKDENENLAIKEIEVLKATAQRLRESDGQNS